MAVVDPSRLTEIDIFSFCLAEFRKISVHVHFDIVLMSLQNKSKTK